MYRILIGSVFHETNSFWHKPTDLERFKQRDLLFGEDITKKFRNTHTPLGAFIEVLEKEGTEIITTVAAIAEPSGTVTKEAFDIIKDNIVSACKQKMPDAVLLSLHGAMETEEEPDGEGCLLEEIRNVAGRDIPIVTTLDLHANLTQRMMDNANAFFPYREYPHSDMYARGLEAANTLMRILKEGLSPVMQWKPIPILSSLIATISEQYKVIADVVNKYNAQDGILGATLLHGFFMADTEDTMASVLTVAESDTDLAEKVTEEIATVAWKNRDALARLDAVECDEAIKTATETEGTVVLADICDNPGAGSSCDGTHLLRALIESKAEKVAYAPIYDPETVEQCHKAGVGTKIPVSLGGKANPELLGKPIKKEAYIKHLSDGIYHNRGPMHGGMKVDLKKTAVIVIDGITIVVSSIPTQSYDTAIFESHGLTMSDFKMLVVKSSVHYRAAFAPHASKLIPVKCRGAVELDAGNLVYKHRKSPLYPLDEF